MAALTEGTPHELPTKTCTKCAVSKSVESFHRHKGFKSGREAICKTCSKAKTYAYRVAKPEAHRDAQRRYLDKNRAECYAKNKVWRSENREYERERSKRRAKENPELHALRARATRMKIRRADVITLLSQPCAYCGAKAEEIDHVVPLSRGGANELSNFAPACQPCNGSKGAKLLEEWRLSGHTY